MTAEETPVMSIFRHIGRPRAGCEVGGEDQLAAAQGRFSDRGG